MITRFGMAPRSPGMSIEDFRLHWRTAHADAAGQIPGVLRYTQNHSLLQDGRYLLGYPGFDACSELDFDSVAAMDEGFASETYASVVRNDEEEFVDKTRFSLVVTNPTVVTDGPAEGIKLIQMFRRHPGPGGNSLGAVLSGQVAEALQAQASRLIVYEPVAEEHTGPPAAFDAIATLWLADQDALDRLFVSPNWQQAAWTLSGVASGSVALAAETIHVV
ncbi:MAG: EthD domain-containing protein [bacterium]|nr:EthD domain-containing protein [bacterium]